MPRILDFEQASAISPCNSPDGADQVAEMVGPEVFARSIECIA